MKISGVDISALSAARANAVWKVELRTDAGVSGSALVARDVGSAMRRIVATELAGRDPRAIVAHWHRLQQARAGSGGDAGDQAAIAALDIALWDLAARHQGLPLWRAVGASRPRLRAHATVGDSTAVPGSSAAVSFGDTCRRMVGRYGLRAIEVRIGDDAAAALQRLEAAGRALAPHRDAALAIDAGARWTVDEAVQRLHEIEARFDLDWVARPVAPQDVRGLSRVCDSVAATVCAAAASPGVEGLEPLLRQRAADAIRIDLARDGITGALEIADAAFGFELPVVVAAAPGNLHVHVAAAMPYCMSVEFADCDADALAYSTDVRVEDGRCIAGDRPGHGLEFAGAAGS